MGVICDVLDTVALEVTELEFAILNANLSYTKSFSDLVCWNIECKLKLHEIFVDHVG